MGNHCCSVKSTSVVKPALDLPSGEIIVGNVPNNLPLQRVVPQNETNMNDGSTLIYFEKVSQDEVNNNMVSMCKQGKLSSVCDLIKKGYNVNVRGMFDTTPLISACQYNHESIVLALLDIEGLDINLSNNKGGTALTFACLEGMADAVASLLNKGALLNIPEAIIYNAKTDKNDFLAPMSAAIINGHGSIVRSLVHKAGDEFVDCTFRQYSDMNTSFSTKKIITKGVSSLMLACKFGHIDIIKFLVEHKANHNLVDSEDNNILHYACRGRNANDTISLLRDLNVLSPKLIFATDVRGDTPLHNCCDGKYDTALRVLLSYFSSENYIMELRQERLNNIALQTNALHGAVQNIISHAMEDIISNTPVEKRYFLNCNPQLANIMGKTPLHLAVKRRSSELVDLLLQHDFDPNVKDKSGVSARDIAIRLPKSSPILPLIDQYLESKIAERQSYEENIRRQLSKATAELTTIESTPGKLNPKADMIEIFVPSTPVKNIMIRKESGVLQAPPTREELLNFRRQSMRDNPSSINSSAVNPETNDIEKVDSHVVEIPSMDFTTPTKDDGQILSAEYASGAILNMVPKYSGSDYKKVTSAPKKQNSVSHWKVSPRSTLLQPPPPCRLLTCTMDE